MAIINGINISEAEFTRMQELGTAHILMRAFKDNVRFENVESIIKDSKTKKGLEDIFKLNNKPIFKFKSPIDKKTPEGKWLTTFYLQQEKMLKEFSNAKFKVFNREGGFMQFITDLIRAKFNIPRKDTWNPADIWLIKEPMIFRKKIEKELEGPSGTQTVKELNAIMRSMFKKREVVGISLKLISGQQAKYEEINVDDKFYEKLEQKTGEYDLKLGKVILKLDLDRNKFKTKDSNIFLFDSNNKEVAKYQLKGNTTSRLSNLVFEPVEKAAGSARLGKAPLELVQKLATFYDKTLYNNQTKQNTNYPTNEKEFAKREKEYVMIFERLSKNNLVKEIGVKSKKEFIDNFTKAFKGPEPWIANVKLMQMYFIDKVLQLKTDKRDEFLTDLLFVSQKKGRKVFDFGAFGKLY